MKKAELAETVKLAQSGNKDAVEALYRQYRERIWFFVCKNVGSNQAAEDIVSDTFLTAIEKLGELRCADAFGSWLYSIAYNKCLQFLNSESGIARFESDELFDSTIEKSILNEPVKLPSDYIESKQTRQQLRNAIDSLKPEMRSAVIMYYFEEMSVADVGKALGLKENAAKQRLFRARKKLSEKLKKLCTNGRELCIVPVGAVLNASLESGETAAVSSTSAAVKVGLTSKIAAVGISAALAVGVPAALIHANSYGDYQPQEKIVSQDDQIVNEASKMLTELVGKQFNCTTEVNPKFTVEQDRKEKIETLVKTDHFIKEEFRADDIGIPGLFLENKSLWEISRSDQTEDSFESRITMRCSPDGIHQSEMVLCRLNDGSSKLYVTQQYEEMTYVKTPICIQLRKPLGNEIEKKLFEKRITGTAFISHQNFVMTGRTLNADVKRYGRISAEYSQDGNLTVSLKPEKTDEKTNLTINTAFELLSKGDPQKTIVYSKGDTQTDLQSGECGLYLPDIPNGCGIVRIKLTFSDYCDSGSYHSIMIELDVSEIC